MNVFLTEKKIGQFLCVALIIASCISTGYGSTDVIYVLMFTIDALLVLHALLHEVKPTRIDVLFVLLIVFFWIRSTRGLNIIASLLSCKYYILWLTIYFSVSLYFDIETFRFWLKRLPLILIPHFLLILLQYKQGYGVDHIGGIYGTYMGVSNAGNHVVILLSAAILIILLISKEITPFIFASGMLICVLCAGVSEIKFYFFEIVVLVLVYATFTNNLFKGVVAIIVVLALGIIGMNIISLINPYYASFLSTDFISEYIGIGGPDLYMTRTNGYRFISSVFFEDNIIDTFLGWGYGHSLTAEAQKLHVDFHSYTHVFLAGGILGTALIFILLFSIFKKGFKKRDTFEGKLAIFVFVISLLTFFYDAQLISPFTSPMYFLALAGCYCSSHLEKKGENDNKFSKVK